MGFFSWNCPGCGKSARIPYTNSGHHKWMTKVVAVYKDGSIMKGEYDGYGRIDERDLDPGARGAMKGKYGFALWHQACWDHAGQPKYKEDSTSAQDQGHFSNELFTIFPPGHDTTEVQRTHLIEAAEVMDQVMPVLEELNVVPWTPVNVVQHELRKRADSALKKIREELDAIPEHQEKP